MFADSPVFGASCFVLNSTAILATGFTCANAKRDEWIGQYPVPIHFGLFGDADGFGPEWAIWVYPMIAAVHMGINYGVRKKVMEESDIGELTEKRRLGLQMSDVLSCWNSLLMLYLSNKAIKIASKKIPPTIGGHSIAYIFGSLGSIFMYISFRKYLK